jgi:hypothetical protein
MYVGLKVAFSRFTYHMLQDPSFAFGDKQRRTRAVSRCFPFAKATTTNPRTTQSSTGAPRESVTITIHIPSLWRQRLPMNGKQSPYLQNRNIHVRDVATGSRGSWQFQAFPVGGDVRYTMMKTYALPISAISTTYTPTGLTMGLFYFIFL